MAEKNDKSNDLKDVKQQVSSDEKSVDLSDSD